MRTFVLEPGPAAAGTSLSSHRKKRGSMSRYSATGVLSRLVVCTSAIVTLAVYGTRQPAHAQQDGPSAADFAQVAAMLELRDLEQTFWRCDYTATRFGMHATPYAACSAVTQELMRRKFDGDFEKLLQWWRQNKQAQHALLGSSDLELSSLDVGRRSEPPAHR